MVSPRLTLYKFESVYHNEWHLTHKTEFEHFCREAYNNKADPAHVNMWDEDWENKPNTLMYLVYKTDKFKEPNGNLYIIFDQEENIVGTTGVYLADFDNKVAVANVRLYVSPDTRGKICLPGQGGTPIQVAWAKERGVKVIISTLNDYNRRLIPVLTHGQFGTGHPVKALDFPIWFNHTKQWVVYSHIDPDYIVDWDKIKYVDDDK